MASTQISFTQTAPFDTGRSMYTPAACTQPFGHFQAALARSQAGTGITRILCNGDSITYGWGATTPVYSNAYEARLAALLEQKTGLPTTFGHVNVAQMNEDPRFTTSGTHSVGGWWQSNEVGATLTYTSVEAGDRVVISYWPQGDASFHVSIDGGSPQLVTYTGNVTHSGWATYTNLPVTTHTVTITVVSGEVYISTMGIERTGGIAITRQAIPGQQSGNEMVNPYTNEVSARHFMLTFDRDPDTAMDLVIEMHGTNDLYFQNVAPAATRTNQASYKAMVTAYNLPTDILLMAPMANGNEPIDDNWIEADTLAAIYAAAEDSAVPLIDFRNAWGTFEEGNARGFFSPDLVHPSDDGYQNMADSILQALGI